jgi:hypothetical protein
MARLSQRVVKSGSLAPGWVFSNACILAIVLPQHDLPGTRKLPEQAPRIVDDKGRNIDSFAVVALPEVEHGPEGTKEVVLDFLGGKAKQPQITAQSVQLAVPEHERGSLFCDLHLQQQ